MDGRSFAANIGRLSVEGNFGFVVCIFKLNSKALFLIVSDHKSCPKQSLKAGNAELETNCLLFNGNPALKHFVDVFVESASFFSGVHIKDLVEVEPK